jgi:hypothetical protein
MSTLIFITKMKLKAVKVIRAYSLWFQLMLTPKRTK